MEELRLELHELIEKYGIEAYGKLIEVDNKIHEEIIKTMEGRDV